MKTHGLLAQLALAIVLTGLGLVSQVMLSSFFQGTMANSLSLSLVLLGYIGATIWQSSQKVGRISLIAVNVIVFLVAVLNTSQLGDVLVIGLLTLWLTRCWLCYSSLVMMAADAGLCLLSFGVFYTVFCKGYGFTSAVWCLLLLQALCVLIPNNKAASLKKAVVPTDSFDQALQTAEWALQDLFKKTG